MLKYFFSNIMALFQKSTYPSSNFYIWMVDYVNNRGFLHVTLSIDYIAVL